MKMENYYSAPGNAEMLSHIIYDKPVYALNNIHNLPLIKYILISYSFILFKI